ncbi:MAG: ATP-dependent sacrificial sulfur transferase LarE [Candidatus Acidiferrales bacterium]
MVTISNFIGAAALASQAPAAIAIDDSVASEKQSRLLESLRGLRSLLVAFSGGADSAYLAWAAHAALGQRALAVTALSASYSQHDREQADAFVRVAGVRHEFIETREFENPLYLANNADRCYHCKNELFSRLSALAARRGFSAIAYGINADDTHDFRPGHRAAHEHRVLAPLLDARLTKAEIRALSHRAALPTWDRPASACLSSRVPYGTQVTPEILARIERAESALRAMEFRQVRVRAHASVASVEIALNELARALEPAIARQIADRVKDAGFAAAEIDPAGYRQGSLNSLLKKKNE